MKTILIARRRATLLAFLVYATTLAGCKEAAAPRAVPSAIQIVAGPQQNVAVGTQLAVSPSVKVVTSAGKGVKGITVTFTPESGSGTVVGGSQVTDANGVATVTSWTLGTKAGTNTLDVSVQGLAVTPIVVTTTPAAPTVAKIASGDAQSGVVGAVLSAQPTIKITDAFDNGVPGITVAFAAAGGGSVEKAQTQTDANGVASAGNWTLGTTSGPQSVSATVNSSAFSTPITFSANAAPDAASVLTILTQPATTNASGQRLTTQPVVEFRDRFGNAAILTAARTVTATVASGAGTLGGTTSVTTQTGRVAFNDLTYTGSGPVQLRFTSNGFADATSSAFSLPVASACAGTAITLNYALGQMTRSIANAANAPRCVDFSLARNSGQQYLMMFENISPRGDYTHGFFPGPLSDDGVFSVGLQASGASGQVITQTHASSISADAPAEATNGWDFGGQTAYEIEPKGTSQPAQIKRNGEWIGVNSEMAGAHVGDTLLVQLEGIPRLGIPTAKRQAIIRYADANIVIAEDLRFTNDPTFVRASGARNSPIADADLQAIASEYAKYALPQANTLFNGRFNSATETDPGRPIAIHTMMSSDNIWGYTYSTTNYFAWDYWVNSTDGHTKDVYQNVQRNSDDLFMHEIAHTRHWGMLERTTRTNVRGNQWLVEGFARFSERLPIAARLLGTQTPSRTSNVVLPFNPALVRNSDGKAVYFFDDVPTYLQTGASMYDGYGASAYVFDYFADQVANAGGNWVAALQELLVAAGVQSDVDAVVQRYLGIDFGTLFTRSRLALYLDDIGTPGLPAWTQYLQYQLRTSRPPSGFSFVDPRNAWTSIVPGRAVNEVKTVDSGGAVGYLIDGTTATADMHLELDPQKVQNGTISIVRIK